MHIGLIGGIGPAATDFYYRGLIDRHRAAGTPLDCTIAHADVGEMGRNLAEGKRAQQAAIFAGLIERMKKAGAEAAAVTSMGGHFCINELLPISPLPLVHGKRSVTSYSVANTTVAFTAAEPHRPVEVYVRTALGERQVTALNADWCATVELPEPEHFIVHSDGGEIDAWVMRPAGFAPGRRYPTLVNMHGGPFVQYGWTFFDEFQVQAGAGYAVLFCNPRGSSGREDAFAQAIIGCPGQTGHGSFAAVSQTVKTKSSFGASAPENSFQVFERNPETS